MDSYVPVYAYFFVVFAVTLAVLLVSGLFPARKSSPVKYMPYESGIKTKTHLLQERFSIHHYLVALMFLVFDIEVVFLYPWAVIAKEMGTFAFNEMLFFLAFVCMAFAYAWKKGGLQWE